MTDLETLYREYVDALQDCGYHKAYLLNSDRCFVEWVEECHPTRIGELYGPALHPCPHSFGIAVDPTKCADCVGEL